MADHKRFKKRRIRMWKVNPHCAYCGVETILPSAGKPPKDQPDNLATIDHKYSRNDPRRSLPANGEQRWILSCKKCNGYRNDLEQLAMPLEERREKSQRHSAQKVIRISPNGAINYEYKSV